MEQNEALNALIVIPPDEQTPSSTVTDSIEEVKTSHSEEDTQHHTDSTTTDVDLNDSAQDAAVAMLDDEHEYNQSHEPNDMKRVKVYQLIGSRWQDHGTAFCYGHFSNDMADGTCEAMLTARSEKNFQDVILSTTIRSTDVYQRQQDTLIVWTEPDGIDYALSFQDKEGCAEVWNFIVDVQRHMNGGEEQGSINLGSSSPLPESSSSNITTEIIRTGHLPSPRMGIIADIEKAIKVLSRAQQVKERLCEYVQSEVRMSLLPKPDFGGVVIGYNAIVLTFLLPWERVTSDYIKQLIDVFHAAEETESLENLHALCNLIQTICALHTSPTWATRTLTSLSVMLNDHSMYEHILDDDLFFGVVGILEYDPEFPLHKANYRDFLNQSSQYHQPISIADQSVQRKIHHTYRLQFLKDVVLARVLDDSTFNVLNSCIIFNQIDIIQHVQQDSTFLLEVVKLYVDEDMLAGGGKKNQQPLAKKEPVTISLNANTETQPAAESSAAATSSPKPVNGALPNGKVADPSNPPASTPPPKPRAYGYAPSEQLSEEELAHRREVILLIHHLCVMGKGVQLPARMALFRTLVDRGILFAVQWALSLSEKDPISRPMVSAGGEILGTLLDHDLNGVRGHVLKQVVAIEKERTAGKRGADKAETIAKMVCGILTRSNDLAVQSLVGDALKVWLDIPMNGEVGPANTGETAVSRLNMRKDDPGTERFMDYFYKDCVEGLFAPLHDLPKWRDFTEPILRLTREETNRYVLLCELLYNFTHQHQFRSHFYILSTAVVLRIATLFKSKDKHLRHASFRFFRLLLKQNNANMHTQVMKYDIIKPILDLTIRESRRDNLLSCSCQEYFDHIRRENMKDLIKFCMTKHEAEIKTLAASPLGGQRFISFIRRWEINNEAPPPEEVKQENFDRAWPSQGRMLEKEEENYFNEEDDDDDSFIPSISQQNWSRGSGASSPLPGTNSNLNLKRKRRMAIAGAIGNKVGRPLNNGPTRSPLLDSLVDYDDDDDSPLPLPSKDASSTGPTPSSPKAVQRPGFSPNRPSKTLEADEEDDLLEAMVNRSRPQSPAPGMMASMSQLGPVRVGGKRRREDDEDNDELLERLTKSKKPESEKPKEAAGDAEDGFGAGTLAKRAKLSEEPPPKKFKLKLGAAAMGNSASNTPPPSEPDAKDGDTG
ncbi:Platinum sensitivity protein [Marasmius tenuissimus]|uniref:Platinum sensitivity protein n=1 Tax=Marasmius tenuissimus TaxID=585030 RepID=A0ABR3A9R5_9AGAR